MNGVAQSRSGAAVAEADGEQEEERSQALCPALSHARSACPLLDVPNDALLHIMAQLDPYDLCTLAQVCSTLNQVSCGDHLWRRFCGSQTSRDGGADALKSHYMNWLRPRLKRYAKQRDASSSSAASSSAPPTPALTTDHEHYEFKFNLIGDSRVGKAALRHRYSRQTFLRHDHYTIAPYYDVRSIQVAGSRVTLQVWNIPGHGRFRSQLSDYAYPGSHGALVVYDITRRQTWINAEDWARDIRSFLSDHDARMVPLILVGTKSDRASERQVSAEEGEDLARELGAIGWAECSSLTGANVDETFYRLAEAALMGVNPFSNHHRVSQGYHIPSEDLLQRLYQGRQVTHNHGWQLPKCVLQ